MPNATAIAVIAVFLINDLRFILYIKIITTLLILQMKMNNIFLQSVLLPLCFVVLPSVRNNTDQFPLHSNQTAPLKYIQHLLA
jgi:hypothetical protein